MHPSANWGANFRLGRLIDRKNRSIDFPRHPKRWRNEISENHGGDTLPVLLFAIAGLVEGLHSLKLTELLLGLRVGFSKARMRGQRAEFDTNARFIWYGSMLDGAQMRQEWI